MNRQVSPRRPTYPQDDLTRHTEGATSKGTVETGSTETLDDGPIFLEGIREGKGPPFMVGTLYTVSLYFQSPMVLRLGTVSQSEREIREKNYGS